MNHNLEIPSVFQRSWTRLQHLVSQLASMLIFLCVWVRRSFWVRPPVQLWVQMELGINGNFVFDTNHNHRLLVVDNYSCLRLCSRTRRVRTVWCFHELRHMSRSSLLLDGGCWLYTGISCPVCPVCIGSKPECVCGEAIKAGYGSPPFPPPWSTCVHLCYWLSA